MSAEFAVEIEELETIVSDIMAEAQKEGLLTVSEDGGRLTYDGAKFEIITEEPLLEVSATEDGEPFFVRSADGELLLTPPDFKKLLKSLRAVRDSQTSVKKRKPPTTSGREARKRKSQSEL